MPQIDVLYIHQRKRHMFLVFQVHNNAYGNTEIVNLYEVRDEWRAQDEVDRINSNLAAAGIPSSVSCAYYQ